MQPITPKPPTGLKRPFLAKAPLRGHSLKDLTKLPVRFWTVVRYPKYLIVCDPADKPLKVIRVFQGGRNVVREFGEPALSEHRAWERAP